MDSDSTDIGSAAVGKLREISVSTRASNGAWSTMSMYACVLISIVVEAHCFGLSTGENWTSLGKNCCFKGLHSFSALGSTLLESIDELLACNLSGSSLLAFSKDKIDVGICAFLVNDLTILGALGESFTVHFISICKFGKHFFKTACTSSTWHGSGSLGPLGSTCLFLTFLSHRLRFSLFGGEGDSRDLMSYSRHVCSSTSFDASNIRIRSIKKSIKTSIGINCARSTVRMDTRVLISIVMESNSIRLCTSQNRSLRACQLSMNCIDPNTFLICK